MRLRTTCSVLLSACLLAWVAPHLSAEELEGGAAFASPKAFSRDVTAFWQSDGQDFMALCEVGRASRWQKTDTAGKEAIAKYSAYFSGMKIFGVPVEQLSLELYAGKLCEVEIMFFNKGDTASRMGFGSESTKSRGEKSNFAEALWDDCVAKVRRALSELGKPRRGKIGSLKLRRSVEIWENGTNAFLLDAEKNEFVRVLVVPQTELKKLTASATERAKGNLRENLVRRPNGDVLVGGIPMIDQGQKGYCVPATVERVLRYYGINELDMHKIAELANTNVGGGTTITGVVRGVGPVVKKNRLKFTTRRMQLAKIRQCVDKGIPMFWSMFAIPEYLNRLKANTQARANCPDAAAWSEQLKKQEPFTATREEMVREAHLCLIIGYNLKTKEICVSDSWGDYAAEQWISFEDAFSVSQKNVLLYSLEK
ncbi:MAG: C39 family peptidase [Opitutales bacterium]|nr:C39 family peptidase [Opitutales bacterium]